MFEIPINIKFHVFQNKHASFFALAGLSSYLMHKETYNYEYGGNGWWESGRSMYYHSTQNWFSIINLSVGYESRLGKIGAIRIEPYAKLPVTGIGKGGLSIMSGGLNVGLSRQF